MTNRFSFGPGSNDGTNTLPDKIYRCEDEPIHIPGAIQRFGALVAMRENGSGFLLVRIASENSHSVICHEPESLFNLRCFTDALTHADKKEFLTRVRTARVFSRIDPDVFSVSLTSLKGAPQPLFCAMHINNDLNLIVCEFELQQDPFNPNHPLDDGLPDEPVRITNNNPTEADRLLSTTIKSKTLHAVRVARETRQHVGSMELFHVHDEIQSQLNNATSLQEMLDIVVGLVYELTSFHRVMVYQFDETAAGSVVSELVDTRASADIYRGLHFPASDIPPQARALYMLNRIRVLYDREQETARLVCRDLEDTTTPLDLKHSYLRAMSPIHLKYLGNMGVRASMSISLVVDNKLWGLISCHNYGSGMRLSLPVRELCRSVGSTASMAIERMLYSSRIKARRLLSKAPKQTTPTAFIAASSYDLLTIFKADFGFLAIKGEARTIGRLSSYKEAVGLLQYIRDQAFKSIFSSQAIRKDCPGAIENLDQSTISGMLVIPLDLSGADFLVFFRKSQEAEIHWAGNPHEKEIMSGTIGSLEPRSSFNQWTESVIGTSREWSEDEGMCTTLTLCDFAYISIVEAATVLSTLYGRFIEVWRQKEAIVQKNRMTRLLIRNAGHEGFSSTGSILPGRLIEPQYARL